MVDSLLNSSSKASEIPLAPQRKSAILTYGLAVCKLWQHCLTCLISMDESLLKNRFSRPTQLTSDCHTEKYFDAMRQTSSKLKYQTNCFFHGVIALKMDLHFSFSNPDLCRLFQSRVKRWIIGWFCQANHCYTKSSHIYFLKLISRQPNFEKQENIYWRF